MLLDARLVNASGIGTYLKALLPGLRKKFNAKLEGDPAELSKYAPETDIIDMQTPIYSVKEQLHYLSMPPSDVLFTPHYNVPLLPVPAKKRVVTIHDVYHLAYYHHLTFAQKAYAKLLINAAVRLSDKVITVSNFSKREIIKYTGCPENKITVIHNGTRQTAIESKANIHRKYSLPEKYILFVGNVKPHKNLSNLLKAYLLLDEDLRAAYKIVIAGKKDGFITGDEQMMQLIKSSEKLAGNIFFTGFVDDEDMDSLYASASLFVFPSLYEGFGLPPLEAMLNKCPVVVSKAASMPEICGNAAQYCDPEDPADIALQITQVLNNDALKMQLIALGEAHIKAFNWENSLAQHQEIFNSLNA